MQVRLSEERARGLRELAAKRVVSVAELVRQAVDRLLREEKRERQKWHRASSVVGAFHGGPPDVSTNHDEYLADDYL